MGRLERRDRFFVLDVRNRDEFEKFRLEGRSPLPSVNIPYFEMLELGGKDEMVDSVSAYVDDLKRLNYGLLLLQSETEDRFVRYLLESLPRFVPEYVDIKRVNAGLLKPVEEDAWALELGKNACALSQVSRPAARES